MTVKELREALLGLPDDAPVKAVDRAGSAECDVEPYVNQGTRVCNMGHMHEVVELWIKIDNRFDW